MLDVRVMLQTDNHIIFDVMPVHAGRGGDVCGGLLQSGSVDHKRSEIPLLEMGGAVETVSMPRSL